MTSSAVPTPRRNGERSHPAKPARFDKSRHAALTPQGPRGVPSVRSDATPTPRSSDKTTPSKAVTADTMPTGQIRPDKTHVRFYPLRDGIHDEGLNLEAIQASGNHDPNDRDRGPPHLKTTRRSTTRGRPPTPVRRPRKPGDDDEGHGGDHVAQDG